MKTLHTFGGRADDMDEAMSPTPTDGGRGDGE